MTIYNIVSDCFALKNLADEAMTDPETGEVRDLTDEEKSEFLSWLNENKDNLENKFNNIYKVYRNLEAEADKAKAEKDTLAAEIDRLRKRAQARENEAGRVKGLFAYAMQRLNMRKYKTSIFSIGFQATRKTAKPVTGYFNPDNIPVEFLKRELSASAIGDAVKDGRLYEINDPLKAGKLFYRNMSNEETELAGLSYLGGEALVIR